MGKQYLLYTLLLTAASTVARAQADFRPGYVIQPAGDTLRGDIDLRDARFNARQCRFRVGAAVTTYQPAQLRAYGLPTEGQHYRSLAPPGSTQPVFMQVLADGAAALYSLRDADRKDHYYVAAPGFALAELEQRKVLLEQERRVQTQNLYRTTLAQALAGCPVAQAQLPALAFTAVALARAVATYNQCQPTSAAPTAVVAAPLAGRPRAQLGIVLGGQHLAAFVRAESIPEFSSKEGCIVGSKVAPVVGIRLGVPLVALSRKLSLETGLLYERERYDYQGAATGGIFSTSSAYQFDFAYLRLPLLLRYTLPKGRVRPLLELGPTLAYAVQLSTSLTTTDTYGRQKTSAFFAGNYRSLQEGLVGGVGLQTTYWQGRSAALLARYEADTGWGSGQGFDTGTNRLYLLLTFDLTKPR